MTAQLDYHALYVLLIVAMLTIVIALGVAAVAEVLRDRRGDRR